MAALIIHEELAERLRAIAQRENRPIENVLSDLLDMYADRSSGEKDDTLADPLNALIGMFDDDITDMSSTVRETMDAYYRRKYGSSD